jgi:molybdopterin converting factor small subunit
VSALLYEGGGSGAPGRDLRVLVNGRSILFLDGLATQLRDGDAVTVYLSGARGWPGG